MATTVVDYVNVRERMADLGCAASQGMAILPTNFVSALTSADFLQTSETATVRTLFRINHIPLDDLVPVGTAPRYLQTNDFEWIAPTLFMSAALMSGNPAAVSVALSVLANYITDFLKGTPGPKTAIVNIVTERRDGRSCKKIQYKGDVTGISALADIIRKVYDDE